MAFAFLQELEVLHCKASISFYLVFGCADVGTEKFRANSVCRRRGNGSMEKKDTAFNDDKAVCLNSYTVQQYRRRSPFNDL